MAAGFSVALRIFLLPEKLQTGMARSESIVRVGFRHGQEQLEALLIEQEIPFCCL